MPRGTYARCEIKGCKRKADRGSLCSLHAACRNNVYVYNPDCRVVDAIACVLPEQP